MMFGRQKFGGPGVVAAALVGLAGAAFGQAFGLIDDFSDQGRGWTLIDDGVVYAGYVDGTYQVTATERSGPILLGANDTAGDGVVSVEATDLPGSVVHYQGIFVRAADSDDYYGFVVAEDGTTVAYHVHDGTATRYETTTLPADAYHLDGPNLIQVFLSGPTLRFVVNDVELATVDDAAAFGYAGLLVVPVVEGFAGTAFDNWRIQPPGG